MTWRKTPADRKRDQETYGSAEYRRNRAAARRRANGHCEQCHCRHARLQCDHVKPVSQGGTHHLDNLRMLCTGAGTCRCHEKKTATEGGGYRQPGRRQPGRRTVKAEDPPAQQRTVW